MDIKKVREKVAKKKAEKEQEAAVRNYKIITEENGHVKSINHPISSFGGGTFIEYYSGRGLKK